MFLAVDNEMTEYLENLAPHKSVFSLDAPRKVSKNLSIPKPVISTMANWIESDDPVDPYKLSKMKELLV